MLIARLKSFYIPLVIFSLIIGCTNYNPKPRGYFRIDFPAKSYQLFDKSCPFSFEYPSYGKVVNDSDKNAEPCWMNIEFKDFKGKIHLSYKPVHQNISKFTEDAHTLAYKHSIKADAIEESPVEDNQRKVYGLIYEIKGNAASSIQFYVTDSVKNFLRGSLYFEAEPNKDSLAPSIDFFRKDILHLIETIKWK
jgi:gliding motility-associated lipoprotein GldD